MHKDFPSLHRAFLHPAVPASEHKIPGVEKPVTSASVPIMGEGPFRILTGFGPPPGRPAAQMFTVCRPKWGSQSH